MKIMRRLLVVLVVLVLVVLLGVIFQGGRMIRTGVNRIGPQVLGVPVTLEDAHFRPLRGLVRLEGLVVGNPAGFQTESLFDMRKLEVELDVRSLFTDTIRIRRILIESPQITYEMGLRRTNLGTLIEDMASDAGKTDAGKEPSAPGKTVVIEELKIVVARARISTPGMGSAAVPVQLATITLNDLGGDGQSTAQITGQVLKAVLGAVGNAALGVGGLVGDGIKAAASGVGELGGAALEGAGTVVGTAADGASAAVGVAADGAKAVVGAAGDGVRAVGSGVGRILGLGKDEEPEPEVAE